MLHRSWRLLVLCVAAGLLLAGSARAATVTSLALGRDEHGPQLAVDVSGSASPHLFTLSHPTRVVLDLSPAVLRPGLGLPAVTPGVMNVRLGRRDDGGVRIVLELAAAARPQLVTETSAEHTTYRVLLGGAAPAAGPAPRPAAGTALAGAPDSLPGGAGTAASAPTPAGGAPRALRALDAGPGRQLVIAVDAGHGGDDPGATGQHGTHEKNVTLAVARSLAERINAEPGMRAYLTRDGDYFVPLRTRIVKAERAQADLFVSVHADAVQDRDISGASVYVLSAHGATSEAARRLADRENAADLVGGVSLKDKDPLLASVLLDLSQSASMSASEIAAELVLKELDKIGDVRKSQVQKAGFLVLKSPDIPSMLVESAYITNPDEERKLNSPAYQGELAAAILAGLKSYLRAHPPAGTRLAFATPQG